VVLALSAAALGAAFLVPYKAAGELAPQPLIVLAMLACAAVLNSATALGQLRGTMRVDRVNVGVACALAGCTVVGNISVLRALATLEPAVASVVTHTQVFFVVVFAWIWLAETPSPRFALGAALALGGFGVMRLTGVGSATVTTDGVMWALLAATMWAAMQVITRRYAVRMQIVFVNAFRLWLAVGVLLVLPGTGAAVFDIGGRAWLYAAAAAFVGPFLARVCLMYAVRHITASHSTLVGLVGPVFAFGFGFAAFGTMPAPLEICGGILIVAGVAIPIRELSGA